MNQLNIPLPYPIGQSYNRRTIQGLVTQTEKAYEMRDATWWFLLEPNGKPNTKVTCFNARNLDSSLWKKPIRERRGLVFATELGESLGKDRYLMKSPEGLALGCVYRDWHIAGKNIRSMAVITRPPHKRFSQYHNKSIPCFLPLDLGFIQEWLDPENPSSHAVNTLLASAKIFSDLEVTRVKTYKNAEALGPSETLKKD